VRSRLGLHSIPLLQSGEWYSFRKHLIQLTAGQRIGNQVSAEFNLIYRWHSAISERDDKWTQGQYELLFPGKNPKDISLQELILTLSKWESSLDKDPPKRNFANLKRQPDGTFNDDGLVEILTSKRLYASALA
jgi:linoleate 8R-lipoxygenase/9,12-octadecadienoate 8-hydroperoxide 8R-isomerase